MGADLPRGWHLPNVDEPLKNPSGLSSLSWRLGTTDSFSSDMQRALPRITYDEENTLVRPLRQLHLSDGDLAKPLTIAWARVLDVLCFYQERLIQEVYLDTAVQPESVDALLAMLGTPGRSATSSTAVVCFHVSSQIAGTGGPDQPVQVPLHTRLRAVPAPGARHSSVPFVTLNELTAWPSQNVMKPAAPRVPTRILGGARGLVLDGLPGGLARGAYVSIRAVLDKQERWWLRRVQSMASSASRKVTLVVLDRPLLPERPNAVLSDPAAWSFTDRAAAFGARATRWEALPTAQKIAVGHRVGGVARFDPHRGAWVDLQDKLPASDVLDIATTHTGAVIAITAKDGVWALHPGAAAWVAAGQGISKSAGARTFAQDPHGRLYTATKDGKVLRSMDGGTTFTPVTGQMAPPRSKAKSLLAWLGDLITGRPKTARRLPHGVVRAIDAAGTSTGGTYILAGTDQGIFGALDGTDAWKALGIGVPGVEASGQGPVLALAVAMTRNGTRIIATSVGLFVGRRAQQKVHRASGVPKRAIVTCLAWMGGGHLVAGTAQDGLWHTHDHGHSWHRWHITGADDLKHVEVRALRAVGPAPTHTLWILTSVALLQVHKGHATRTLPPPPFVAQQLCLDGAGEPIVCGPWAGFDPDAWPGWPLHDDHVALDKPSHGLLAGQVFAAHQPDLAPWFGTVQHVAERPVDGFGQHRSVSVVDLERTQGPALHQFDRRQITLLAASRPLPLSQEQIRDTSVKLPEDHVELARWLRTDALYSQIVWRDVHPTDLLGGRQPQTIRVQGSPRGLRPARDLIIQGPSQWVCVLAQAGLTLRLDATGRRHLLPSGTKLQLVAQPAKVSEGRYRWRLRTDDGVVGTVEASTADISVVPATLSSTPSTRAVKERTVQALVATIASVQRDGDDTIIELQAPLALPFDPLVTTVRGNVVTVGEGAMARQTLGSGDPSTPNQVFQLNAHPLSRWPEPWGVSLQVLVDELPWRPIDAFGDALADDPVYVIEDREPGPVTVRFGDGVHGRRLPAGDHNIVALYCYGASAEGNVGPGQIRLLVDRPLGVRTVDNPLPGVGGTSTATNTDRDGPPKSTLALGRAVVLDDYPELLQQLSDVQDARAQLVLVMAHRGILISVLGTTNSAPTRARLDQLADVLRQVRASALPIYMAAATIQWYTASICIWIASTAERSELDVAVRAALVAELGPASAALGRRVHASDLEVRVQAVPGVVAVQVQALELSDATDQDSTHRVLHPNPAQPPRPGHPAVGAGALMLEPEAGVLLTWKVVSA